MDVPEPHILVAPVVITPPLTVGGCEMLHEKDEVGVMTPASKVIGSNRLPPLPEHTSVFGLLILISGREYTLMVNGGVSVDTHPLADPALLPVASTVQT